ncbi:hypothetical protein RFI_16731 [Reticulomyxa filosa]|uniref:Polycystin cation channel PKD1/PKD2 domain-containing protein n=1 Tax=Reticulomyxa filosa TaxID=46433 RepID=X6N353_RETFI|nr:hypothetical protein RFI_16731 [Reticulomyxa filosa]|eukprot:ETO20486.1 hypothetical protein RFI_16731 [Reticulomyxa filosa]
MEEEEEEGGEEEGGKNDTSSIRPIKMELIRYKYPDEYTYCETRVIFGAFNNTSTREEVLHSMDAMHLSFEIENQDLEEGSEVCYVNRVKESYKYSYRGHLQLKVRPSVYLCGSEYHKDFWKMHFMPLTIFFFLVMLFCAFLEYLHIKAVIKHIEIYQLIKRQTKSRREEWRNLSWRDKLEFFNVWFFVTSIGNIASIIGSMWCVRLLLFETKTINLDPPFFFVGIGCMFLWISLVQYLEQFPHYYFLILTLKTSSPRVLAFVVGVLPIFIGFACFGVAYFASSSSMFSSIDQAAVTLFSLLNGDSIHDVFAEVYSSSPVISRFYLYVFIALFIYAVLNIFIAIVEDAFFASKRSAKNNSNTTSK